MPRLTSSHEENNNWLGSSQRRQLRRSPLPLGLILTHILQLGFMKQRERPGATVDWFTSTSMVIGFSGLPRKMWVRIRSFKRGSVSVSHSLLGGRDSRGGSLAKKS